MIDGERHDPAEGPEPDPDPGHRGAGEGALRELSPCPYAETIEDTD